MRDSARLARLYRKSGHADEARAMDAHLLKLLAANSHHPLVLELRRLRQPERDALWPRGGEGPGTPDHGK